MAHPKHAADCWYLTGPTASGKTSVALELSRILGAEVISLDSMALYRGMDIGTAKPTPEERRRVPHHLVDVIDLDEEFSLARYLAEADAALADVQSRGREGLFVGGTPLYLKGLLRGIFEGPAADWELRAAWEAAAERHDPGWLHAQLASVDPVTAGRLHKNDTRRLIRALEVYEKTGLPISQLQRQFEHGRPANQCRVFCLHWPREELDARIDRRVEQMFRQGLVDEVTRLLTCGKELSRTARQAVGYREVIEHLVGERDLAETISLVKTRTRQFAKRQLTWFRSLPECRPLRVKGQLDPLAVAQEVFHQGMSSPRPDGGSR